LIVIILVNNTLKGGVKMYWNGKKKIN